MYRRSYCLRWRLSPVKFNFKFAERLYLSNVSRNGIVSSSAIYSLFYSVKDDKDWFPTNLKNLSLTFLDAKTITCCGFAKTIRRIGTVKSAVFWQTSSVELKRDPVLIVYGWQWKRYSSRFPRELSGQSQVVLVTWLRFKVAKNRNDNKMKNRYTNMHNVRTVNMLIRTQNRLFITLAQNSGLLFFPFFLRDLLLRITVLHENRVLL